jgi:four helix bundle protein
MAFLFEKLKAYQVAMSFAHEILRLTSDPPRGTSNMVDQLRRAAMSISANLAEGSGRWHRNDRKQFFWIARGSVNECVPFLELAVKEKILCESDYQRLKDLLEMLARMITALIAAN